MHAVLTLLPLLASLGAASPAPTIPTHVKRQTPLQPPYPVLGCFSSDWMTDPDVHSAAGQLAITTQEGCASQCLQYNEDAGITYLQYYGYISGRMCYCADSIDDAAKVDDSECFQPCSGNANETCGTGINWAGSNGTSHWTAFQFAIPPPPPPTWHDLGCHEDKIPGALRAKYEVDLFGMTREKCQSTCATGNYTYAGVESAILCACDNTFHYNVSAPASDCNVPCPGNNTETCGGILFRMSLMEYY